MVFDLCVSCDCLRLLQQPKLEKHFPPMKAVAGVHFEQPDGGSSRGGLSHNAGAILSEVVAPVIPSGMEQRRQNTGVGINATEVGAFLEIALGTGEREVGGVIGAAVLPGDDVFDVETESGSVLGETTVFAAVSRPLPDQVAGGAVHLRRLRVGEKGVRLGLEDAEQRVGTDDGFEFNLFVGSQLAFGASAGELIVAGLRFGVGLHPDERPRQFGGEVPREWPQEPLQCCGLAVCHGQKLAPNAAQSEEFLYVGWLLHQSHVVQKESGEPGCGQADPD